MDTLTATYESQGVYRLVIDGQPYRCLVPFGECPEDYIREQVARIAERETRIAAARATNRRCMSMFCRRGHILARGNYASVLASQNRLARGGSNWYGWQSVSGSRP